MLALLGFVAADAIYVSAKGNDLWPGAAGRPVASLARAVELARAGHLHRIVVGRGEYALRASVALDARDSALTIEAAKGERPLLTGARVIPARSVVRSQDPLLRARAPKGAAAYRIDVSKIPGAVISPFSPYGFPRPIVAGPSELYADDQPLTIARWPNEGFTTIKSVQEAGNGEGEQDQPVRRPVFMGITDRAKTWKSIDSAWLYGYWRFDWADETIKIHAINPASGAITLETPHTFGVGPDVPYFIQNLPEELDAPGEYFADPNRKSIDLIASNKRRPTYRFSQLGDPMITIRDADGVTIRGIDFAYSRGDGALVERSRRTRFEACQFYNLGERAAVINDGKDSGLVGCNIWNTGEGGVILTGGDRNTLTPAGLFVENCDIHNYQRRSMTYRPGVWLNGVGNRVSHCAIHDAPHSAILFGGNDHVIELNEFFRTISRTGDGGVVYTGRDWTARGTDVRSNYFHDNIGIRKWETAIYFDDLASGLRATNNLIERCHWAFLIGGGRDNIVSGNTLIDNAAAFHADARGLGWAAKSRPTMVERLNAVPFASSIWRAAYPTLLDILDKDPMAPAGNVIKGNSLIRSGKVMQDTEAPFAKTTLYEGNTDDSSLHANPPARWGLVDDAVRKLLPGKVAKQRRPRVANRSRTLVSLSRTWKP